MADLNNGAMTGTDRLNHAAAIGSSKFAGRGAGVTQAMQTRPMYGHGEAADQILKAAGLGRRTPDKRSPGEQMSDANGPTQDVQVQDGQAVHRKATSDGDVVQRPIAHYDILDNYPHLDQPLSAQLATLQNAAGYPLP